LFSQAWLAMPQLVLQADWQEVWHSPQPPFFALSQRLRVLIVLIFSMILSSVKIDLLYYIIYKRHCQPRRKQISYFFRNISFRGLSEFRCELNGLSVVAFCLYVAFVSLRDAARNRKPYPEAARCGTVIEKKRNAPEMVTPHAQQEFNCKSLNFFI